MSDTITNTGTVTAPTAHQSFIENAEQRISTGFADVRAAIVHGAAFIYPRVMKIVTAVSDIEKSNPAVGALLDEGVVFVESFIERASGLPSGSIKIVADDLISGLHTIAAADASVSTVTAAS